MLLENLTMFEKADVKTVSKRGKKNSAETRGSKSKTLPCG
jgi:hypothetical protein